MGQSSLKAAVGLVLTGLLATGHAFAQVDQDLSKLCARPDFSLAEAAIGACTRIIAEARGTSVQISAAYTSRGVSRARLNQMDAALADYTAAIQLDPENALALTNRGSILLDKKQDARARADYLAALNVTREDASNAQAHGAAQEYLASRGEPSHHQLAIDAFGEAIRLSPTWSQPYFRRGSAQASLGNFQLAVSDYDQALRLDPSDTPTYSQRAVLREYLGQRSGAFADIDRAIQLAPAEPSYRARRAWMMLRQDRTQEAITDYNAAVQLRPNAAEYIDGRGDLFLTIGDYSRARDDYDAAVRLKPEEPAYLYDRAIAHERLGEDNLADKDYEAIRAMKAQTANDFRIQGFAAWQQMKWDEVTTDFRQALALESGYASIHVAFGSFEFLSERLDNAERWHASAIALAPLYADAHGERGVTLLMRDNQGDAARADAALRRANELRLSPDAGDWLWRALAAGRRAKSEATTLGILAGARPIGPQWPAPVIGYFLGKISATDLLAQVRREPGRQSADHEASADFWIAERALLQGRRDEAMDGFGKVVSLSRWRLSETAAAKIELKRLQTAMAVPAPATPPPAPAPAPAPSTGNRTTASAVPMQTAQQALARYQGKWAVGSEQACRTNPYILTVSPDELRFLDSRGQLHVEHVDGWLSMLIKTTTTQSPDEPVGTHWMYSVISDDILYVTNTASKRSFELDRCH